MPWRGEYVTREAIARSLFFGESLFLSFRMPEDWLLMNTSFPVDVEETVVFQGVSWVQTGHLILTLIAEGDPLRLEIKAKRSEKRLKFERMLKAWKGTPIPLKSGHKAVYKLEMRLRRKYLIFGRPEERSSLKFYFHCPETSRDLLIEIYGSRQQIERKKEGLIRLVQLTRCH